MYPIDLLSEQEQKDIKKYLHYVNHQVPIYDGILDHWNKAKIRLLRALGGQLRVRFPCDIPLTRNEKYNVYRNIFYDINISESHGIRYYDEMFSNFESVEYLTNNKYVATMYIAFFKYLKNYANEHHIPTNYVFPIGEETQLINDLKCFDNLFKYDVLDANNYTRCCYNFNTIHLSIDENTKPLRAIRKALSKIGFTNWDCYEKWSNQISDVHTHFSSYRGNLVLSIHPIDYLTLSDNSLGWHSCLNMINEGSYSSGPLALMNSNNTIVAYLESNMPFYFHDIEIPNKRWRVLVTLNKDCIIVGKAYPYQNDNVSMHILDKVEELVGQTVKWTYKYHKQQYKDMYSSWQVPQDGVAYLPAKEKRIYVNAKGLYNDLIESNRNGLYYISRNPIKHSKVINITGKTYCVKCGEELDDYCYSDSGSSDKLCGRCYTEETCSVCGHFFNEIDNDECYDLKVNGIPKRICGKCAATLNYLPQEDTLATEFYWNRAMNGIIADQIDPCLQETGFNTFTINRADFLNKHRVRR